MSSQPDVSQPDSLSSCCSDHRQLNFLQIPMSLACVVHDAGQPIGSERAGTATLSRLPPKNGEVRKGFVRGEVSHLRQDAATWACWATNCVTNGSAVFNVSDLLTQVWEVVSWTWGEWMMNTVLAKRVKWDQNMLTISILQWTSSVPVRAVLCPSIQILLCHSGSSSSMPSLKFFHPKC